jgi:hypothetical protein
MMSRANEPQQKVFLSQVIMGSLASVSRRPIREEVVPTSRTVNVTPPPTTKAPANVGRVRPAPPPPPELRLNIWDSTIANVTILERKAKSMCPRGLDVQDQIHRMLKLKEVLFKVPQDLQLMDVSLLDGRVVGFAALFRNSAFELREDKWGKDTGDEMYTPPRGENVCVIRILCAQPPFVHWVLNKILQHLSSDRACDYTQIAVRVEDIPTFLKEGFVLGPRPRYVLLGAEAFAEGVPRLSPGELTQRLWPLLIARIRSSEWENSRAILLNDETLARQILDAGVIMSKPLR